MSKRSAVILVAVTAAAALAAGGAIGFVWHAPGSASTWNHARDWLTFSVIFLGLGGALLQLELQRRQLGILQHDLSQREQMLELQQANYVLLDIQTVSGVVSGVLPPGSSELVLMAVVTNNSDRPIRNVVSRLILPGEPPLLATRLGQIADEQFLPVMRARGFRAIGDGASIGVILAHAAGAFAFPSKVSAERPAVQLDARLTDDAGLHWEIGPDMGLVKLDRRDW